MESDEKGNNQQTKYTHGLNTGSLFIISNINTYDPIEKARVVWGFSSSSASSSNYDIKGVSLTFYKLS